MTLLQLSCRRRRCKTEDQCWARLARGGLIRESSRYSTRRQLQKAICRVSVVTQTTADPQNAQPADRVSRLMVQRGIEMESGLSNGSIAFLFGRTEGN